MKGTGGKPVPFFLRTPPAERNRKKGPRLARWYVTAGLANLLFHLGPLAR
jgi:hypothetical protein